MLRLVLLFLDRRTVFAVYCEEVGGGGGLRLVDDCDCTSTF